MYEPEEKTSHSCNNKLLIEAITTMMNQKLDALYEELQLHGSGFENVAQRREQGKKEIEPKPPDHIQDISSYKKWYEKSNGSRAVPYKVPANSTPISPKKQVKKRTRSLIFSGTSKDPEAYLQWEDNMEKWLQSNNIPKERKLKQAVSALTGKANKWWLKENAPTDHKQPVLEWRVLKERMYKEFVEKSRATLMMKTPPSSPALQEELNVSSSGTLPKPPAAPHQAIGTRLKELDKEEKVQANALSKPTNDPELMALPTAANNVQLKPDQSTKRKMPQEETGCPKDIKDQPLPIYNGMNESSNSTICANEIFMCHGKEKDANANTMVLEESAKSNTKDEVPRSLPLTSDLELPTSHQPKPIHKSSHDYPNHCKETSLFDAEPILFVLVSNQEEKCFGLEKVKEFCVSENVFNKIIPTFNSFELEKNFDLNRIMCSELNSSLGNSSSFKMSDLFRTKAEFAYLRTVSKQLLENFVCVKNPISVSCELSLNDPGFDNYYSKLVYSNLVANSIRFLFALCSKKALCDNLCFKVRLIYDLVYPLIFDHTDIICLSLSKEPNAGFEAPLKRKRRTYKREEDKRFKPPDLDQDKHQDISFFMLVKEAPPDAPYKPKPSLNRIGGNFLIIQNSVNINLSFVHAVGSDLRTNPFEEGGDDMNLTSSKEMVHEPDIDPAPNWQHAVILGRNRTRSTKRPTGPCPGLHHPIQGRPALVPVSPSLSRNRPVPVPVLPAFDPFLLDHRPDNLDHRPRILTARPGDLPARPHSTRSTKHPTARPSVLALDQHHSSTALRPQPLDPSTSVHLPLDQPLPPISFNHRPSSIDLDLTADHPTTRSPDHNTIRPSSSTLGHLTW